MAFSTMSDGVDNISALGDNPNTDNNLSAAQLKAKFDQAAVAIKTYLNNTLVSELNTYETTVSSALNGKMSATGVLPSNVGIKIGTATPTYGTGDNQITDGQIYLKYTEE